MPLSVGEFLSRFLLRILPQGFVRIRNFGFLANRQRATLWRRCLMLRALPTASLILLFVVQISGQNLAQTPDQPAKPLTLTQVWTLDATYTDHQHGVTFRYPSAWEATTQFGYHQPALTVSEATPVAGFGYSEGGFPRGRIVGPYAGTNLEGVGIVYSTVPVASAPKCEAKAASLSDSPKHSHVILGQRCFSVYETGESGMSQSIEGELYAAYVGSTCYLFETDVAMASPGALDDIPALTPAQLRDIHLHLLNIMKSVRVTPNVRKQS
jgi:hypothetical protein